MTDTVAIDAEYLPESADEFSKPVVIERSDLDELEAAAETDGDEYEELRAEMERLADAKEERDELRERVDELEEYEERLEEVDEMREALASDLAEDVDHFDADELSENFSVSELRSKIEAVDETADDADSESETEELDDEPEATEADEPDPAPRGGTETEELEAELTEEEQQRVADLEDTIEWYHDHNWETAAEELEAELDELTADQ
jgi:chromosome segregation ATPase